MDEDDIEYRDVDLPHNGWEEREYQQPLWDYLADGGKRAYAVWHRRAGKDDIALHYCAMEMHKRVGNVWYCLPEYNQGRKAIWTAVNPHTGMRRIDEAFPDILRENTNDNEMFIRFKNGSTFQVVGSDQHSRTVGASPMIIVFSEWSLANPSAWAYYRPILEENNGVAVFITTPRGRNHAHAMALYAEQSPDWFYQLLTVEDTGALTAEQLAETKKEYAAVFGVDMGNALYRQELYCDFNAAVLGAFYAHEMAQVRAEGRIAEISPPPGTPVNRAWDLGIGDDTSVWKWSIVGSQLFIYSHLATSGVGLEWWRDALAKEDAEHGWTAGTDWVPHDAKAREMGTGRSRVETMRSLGLKPMLVPGHSVDDGINAARRTLPLCVFHPRCEEGGVSALEQYRREWDDDKKAFRASAVHDWTSHPADAFRYLSLSWRTAPAREVKVPKRTGFFIPPPQEDRKGMRL
jgi:phage terminase large subunit